MYTRNPHTPHRGRIAERLTDARRRRFVGRTNELRLFHSALNEPEPPFSVLYVYGPGGVGKTTLLKEFERCAVETGLQVIWLDGRNMEASPPGFVFSLAGAMGLAEVETASEVLADDWSGIMFIDTYELLTPLDSWLREVFLPQMPARSLVVLAGRNPPEPGWRTDPGWSELVRIVPLRNLTPGESRSYLDSRGIAQDQHRAVLEFTYGHPLALSLVSDVLNQGESLKTIDHADHPDIVAALVERFVQSAPSPAHRQAIQICAHTRVTTGALLTSIFGEHAGHELFNWLRGLSFIERGAEGLFPHDLARDVLDADLQWRDPDAYRQIHRTTRNYIVERLQRTQGIEQQRAFFDLLFLHRNSPFMKPHHDWKALGNAYAEPARADDFPEILAVVERHIGSDSAKIAGYWIHHSPDAFVAYRTRSDEMIGFACALTLAQPSQEDLEADPGLRSVWSFASRNSPPRPGEAIMVARFAMGTDGRMDGGPVANMVAMSFTTYLLTTPNLAWSFIVEPFPDIWHASHVYLNQFPAPGAGFELDGIRFEIYSHDWRVEPPLDWLETMADREIATDLKLEVMEAARPAPLIVLSLPEFHEAVRRALRDYNRPDRLKKNPLLRSRLVGQNSHENPRPERLRELIKEAADTLRGNPRDEKFYRALLRTYFEPAATQELAAESLDLPFSTYRYHLNNALDRISEFLWEREINPSEK